MAHHTFLPKRYHYTFGPHTPELSIVSGDTLTTRTRDCRGQDGERNPLPENMKPSAAGTDFQQSNPVVGPIVVKDARRGDCLRVHIDRITIDRDYGMSKQNARFGSLTGEWPGHPMHYPAPIETRFFDWKIDPERLVGTLLLPNSKLTKVEVPLVPFIGSIGVAPPMGRVETTMTPGEFGGNMDYRGLTEGVSLYLPVWVDGGYLGFGDVHALQGDGETNGTAVEVSAEVSLTVEVVKNKKIGWPRAENEDYLIVLGSARPLEDCVRLAMFELLLWLVDDYGFEREEAWQLMGQLGRLDIANVVDPAYTVAAKFPKRYLPRPSVT
ncbi:MAG: acetamidase/formamidase family protein [Treponemataceae bacterium]